MIKVFFVSLIICVFSVNFLIAQNGFVVNRKRDHDNLLGSVKRTETSLIDFISQNSGVVEQKRPWVTNVYDVRGNLSENVVYLHDGNLHTDMHLYDAKDLNVECRTYSNEADKAADKYQKYIHKFDANGRLTERIVTEFDGSPTARFVFNYDARGNKIEYRNYYHTGALGGKIVYAYHNNGGLLSQIYSDGNGNLIWKHIYIVNDKAQTIEDKTYIGETLRYQVRFVYDDKGRVVQRDTSEFNAIPNQWTSHSPEPGKIVFIYDDKAKTKEEIKFNKNGFLEKSDLHVYDEKGVEIERVWYESGGSFDDVMQSKDKTPAAQRKLRGIFKWKITYRYEYDTQGNWTKKTRWYQSQENESAKPQSAEYRTISYY